MLVYMLVHVYVYFKIVTIQVHIIISSVGILGKKGELLNWINEGAYYNPLGSYLRTLSPT